MTVTDPFRTSRTGDAPWEVLAGGSMTGGAVTFGDARLPGRTSGPALHVHSREDEAAYVIEGIMTFRVGEEAFEAGAGTLVWLPRRVPHTFANLSDQPAWVFGAITPAGLEGMFAEQAAYFATLTGPPDESRIDEIGARWGVTLLGPPLRATSRADDDRFGGAQNA
jgi:mannose-6-phosphate isomerase-like protein (cupin superfamily)